MVPAKSGDRPSRSCLICSNTNGMCVCVKRGIFLALISRTEPGDRDLNCVVSGLAQLCLDPSARSLFGFQRLIEKEFVALGHRFQERLGLIRSESDREVCFFLSFAI